MHKFITALLVIISLHGYSQELNFNVKVVAQTKILSDPAFLQAMEKSISDFMNNTAWTDNFYEDYEKIKGTLQLTITSELVQNSFDGELILKTERPVYYSNYSSPILNIIDKHVSFNYNGSFPLRKTTNVVFDQLSSLLSYYAYVSIGLDEESFKNGGGEPMMQKAQELVNTMVSSGDSSDGWSNISGFRNNRYYLVENFFNPQLRQFRQAFYEYHRMGLDKLYLEAEKSRAVILSSLTAIGQANTDYPGTKLLNEFSNAKATEVVEIFSPADRGQKSKVMDIMLGIDPSKSLYYVKLAQ
ncbi:MAG: DUF4835 family protein [Lewinellaceae bacterium]|nr:DUF4835 family protein [Lewinellaceae bacterium]